MKKNKVMQEHISAMMDAELTDEQIASMLNSQDQDMQKTWETYHQIGDVLRSEEMAIPMHPDFSVRMAARLEAEPSMVAPVVTASRKQTSVSSKNAFYRRFAVPGAVAATIAAMAIFAGTSIGGGEAGLEHTTPASTSVVAESAGTLPKEEMVQASLTVAAGVPEEKPSQEIILRDPHIDEYLMAHQRFSPSVYSTTPYTRASAFAGKSEAGQ